MQALPKDHFHFELKIPKPTVYDEIAFNPWTAAVVRTESSFWDDKGIQKHLEDNNYGILKSKAIRRAIHLIAVAFLWIPYLIIQGIHKGIVKRKNKDAHIEQMFLRQQPENQRTQDNMQILLDNQVNMFKKFEDVIKENKALKALLASTDKQRVTITKGLQNLPNMVRGRVNVCFLNSALQCFAHIPILKEFVKDCTPDTAQLLLKTTLLDLLNELDNDKGNYFKVNDLHLKFINAVKANLKSMKEEKAKQAKAGGSEIPNDSGFKLDGNQQCPSEFLGWLFNRLVTKKDHYSRISTEETTTRTTFDENKKEIRKTRTTAKLSEIFISRSAISFKARKRKIWLDTNHALNPSKVKILYNSKHPNEDSKVRSYIDTHKNGKPRSKREMKKELTMLAENGFQVAHRVDSTSYKTNIVGQKFLFIRNTLAGSNPDSFPLTFHLPSGKKYKLGGAICHTVGVTSKKMPSGGHYTAKVKKGTNWLRFNDLDYRHGKVGGRTTAPTKASDHGFLYVYTLQSDDSCSNTTKKTQGAGNSTLKPKC